MGTHILSQDLTVSYPDNNLINIIRASVSQSLVCIRVPGDFVKNSDSQLMWPRPPPYIRPQLSPTNPVEFNLGDLQ